MEEVIGYFEGIIEYRRIFFKILVIFLGGINIEIFRWLYKR